MQHPELEPGDIPQEVELRWIAGLRDYIRRFSYDLLSKSLHIRKVNGDVELHAYLEMVYAPGHELQKAIKSMCHQYARRETKLHRLHSVEVLPPHIRLIIYKKPQKRRKVR